MSKKRDEAARREWVRQLFDQPAETPAPPDPDPLSGNHVPNEGDNPEPPDGDRDLRDFTRQLFNDNDH